MSRDEILEKYKELSLMYKKSDDVKDFEADVAPAIKELGITSIPYYGLSRGFLTGKYRKGVEVQSMRAQGTLEYQNDRGWAILETVEKIAKQS